MKIVAIIQARMSSTRLPGKVLKELGDKTVLEHVIQRAGAAEEINEIIVATTTKNEDDKIVALCRKIHIPFFRGDENDVLSRYFKAATEHHADVIVRITSDCPLLDPELLSKMIRVFLEKQKSESLDYLSNTLKRTFPRGLDIEIFSYEVLKRMHQEAQKKEDREHVTLYLITQPNQFRKENYEDKQDYSYYRWTLDTMEDFEFIQSVYHSLYNNGKDYFPTADVIHLLEKNPQLARTNQHIQQKGE